MMALLWQAWRKRRFGVSPAIPVPKKMSVSSKYQSVGNSGNIIIRSAVLESFVYREFKGRKQPTLSTIVAAVIL